MTDDLEQPAFSDDERREILRRARETAARSDDQEILPRDLDQPFGDDERRSILHRAHTLLVGHEPRGNCRRRSHLERRREKPKLSPTPAPISAAMPPSE